MGRFRPLVVALLTALLSGLASACHSPERSAALGFRGPLAGFVRALPNTLAACRRSHREYATPFHHAPYHECTDSSGGHAYTFEVDADSEVTEVSTEWRVAPAERQAQFEAERAGLTHRYGHGFACAPGWLVWRSPDDVHVALRMRPMYSSDVDLPPADSVPWRIERLMRWGPLLDLYWCGAATEHLGT